MNKLELLISSVTQDLWNIQREFVDIASSPSSASATTNKIENHVDQELLSEFKAAVDHSRHLIWSYVEEIGRQAGAKPDDVLWSFRIRRATEMLRLLRAKLEDPSLRPTHEAWMLLAEIQSIATHGFAKPMGKGDMSSE